MSEFLMALIFALMGASAQAAATPSYVEGIRQVSCTVSPELGAIGTANVIKKNRILTAHHVVTGKSDCEFNGKPITNVLYSNADEDIAVLEVDTGFLPVIPYSCKGFETDQPYMALGYPGSFAQIVWRPRITMTGHFPNSKFSIDMVRDTKPVLAANILIAQDGFKDFEGTQVYPVTSHHLRKMKGSVMPGMSGGGVLDHNAVIIGIITATNGVDSTNRDLADTGLCKGKVPA